MSGNPIVDKMYGIEISGNVTPQSWYQTVVNAKGRPVPIAIMILSEIVYWYRPVEERDELNPKSSIIRKKFGGDLLQMSYQQLSKKFGFSKSQVKTAIVFLEELGVIRRVFRNMFIRGTQVNNVMYIELDPDRLYELTYPEKPEGMWQNTDTPMSGIVDRSVEKTDRPLPHNHKEDYQKKNTDISVKQQTNTEITSESNIENTEQDIPSTYHKAKENFCRQI